MNKITKTNYFVLTGAMGGGKSTLLGEISKAGIRCVAEPAREILVEQRASAADGVPEQNPARFCQLMLSRSLQNYNQALDTAGIVVFDRGIPDMIAYAEGCAIDTKPFYQAAEQNRYNPTVFFFAGWEAIYTNDAERKISFEGARQSGERVRLIYEQLGYQLVNVPLQSIAERTTFILERLLAVKP
ncbi:MAG: ATPase [Caldilinea sp. CFX5]|nr:ATPase [Caldilinea sp. CFX5]